jgi:hypothetical protein
MNIDQQIESYLKRFDAMTPEQKKRQLDLALNMLPNALGIRRGRPVHAADKARPQRIQSINEFA